MENNESKIKTISLILTILVISVFVIKTPWIKIINRDFFPVLNRRDIRIFYYTDIEDLAIAVDRQDSISICKILEKNPELVNEKDDVFGTTVLSYAVTQKKYRSMRILMKYGADPSRGDNDQVFISVMRQNDKVLDELLKSPYLQNKGNLLFTLSQTIIDTCYSRYYERLIILNIIRYDEEGALLGDAIYYNRYDFAIDLLQRGACVKNDVEFKRTYASKHFLTD
ncbi:MAG: hypothetical protein J6X12_07310, partial [Paludibacteraceae bacterium]|nr:hypothetical protein [Paludibacteraceae bacterium]